MLLDWVDLARNSASARNAQCIKYILSTDETSNAQIFDQLAWAGYLKDWPGPEEGERPSAYVILLLDTLIADNFMCDDGIASQSILLGATEAGLGMHHQVCQPQEVGELLDLSDQYEIIQYLRSESQRKL